MKNIPNKYEKCLNTLHYFDIFGQPPNFTILNKERYTSPIGLIVSLFFEIIMLFYLTNEIYSMISYQKPSIFQTEVQVSETNPYYLLNENFTLAVTVANRYSEPLIGQNKYFKLNISQCIRTRTKDHQTGNISVQLNCTELPIEPCNMSHFTTQLQIDYFSRFRFGAMQCINREFLIQNPPSFQGQFNALNYRYLSIQLQVCQNTSDFNGCASEEEIQEILQTGHYGAYYSDYLSKLDQPGEAYEQFINFQFSGFSISTSKLITQLYRIIDTISDEGFIWEQNSKQDNLQFQEWRETQDFYNGQYLINHYIILDYKSTINNRTYIKIQQVLARIGGVLQIFILLFSILLRPLIKNFMNFEIANKLFKFKYFGESQDLQQNEMIKSERQGKYYFEQQIQTPKDNQGQQNLVQQQHTFWQMLLIIFGIKKKEHQMYKKAQRKITKNLDIVQLIKKLQEVELLKKIIFTKEQLKRFKEIPLIIQDMNVDKASKDSLNHFSISQNKSLNIASIDKNQQIQFNQKENANIYNNFIDFQFRSFCEDQAASVYKKQNYNQDVVVVEDINEPSPQIPK